MDFYGKPKPNRPEQYRQRRLHCAHTLDQKPISFHKRSVLDVARSAKQYAVAVRWCIITSLGALTKLPSRRHLKHDGGKAGTDQRSRREPHCRLKRYSRTRKCAC